MCAARKSRRRQEMADGLINALGIYESTLTGSRRLAEVPPNSGLPAISGTRCVRSKLTHCPTSRYDAEWVNREN